MGQDDQKQADFHSYFITYLQVVSRAISFLYKSNCFSEAALIIERCEDLRKSIPQRLLPASNLSNNSSSVRYQTEAILLKRKVQLLLLQILASYGVFVVKSDQFSVDIDEAVNSLDHAVTTF